MELTHHVTIPGTVAQTWRRFGEVDSLAQCLPGLVVTSLADGSFEGTLTLTRGPIARTYSVSGTYTEKDEATGRLVLEVDGRDEEGHSTVTGTITAHLAASPGGTELEVATDLSTSGEPAQFGHAVVQELSEDLLQQLVACLESRVDTSAGEESVPESAEELAAADMVDEGGPIQPPPGRHAASRWQDPGDALDLDATAVPGPGRWERVAAGVVAVVALAWLARRLAR